MTVPVSAGLLADTRGYFDALGAFRDGDVEPIVRCFADASFAAVRNGRELVADLGSVSTRWHESLTARRGAAAWTLLPFLIGQPAVTVRLVQDHARVSQPAAQRAIDRLAAAGILTPATANKRNRVWIATDVTDSLDAFAARAGRRG